MSTVHYWLTHLINSVMASGMPIDEKLDFISHKIEPIIQKAYKARLTTIKPVDKLTFQDLGWE